MPPQERETSSLLGRRASWSSNNGAVRFAEDEIWPSSSGSEGNGRERGVMVAAALSACCGVSSFTTKQKFFLLFILGFWCWVFFSGSGREGLGLAGSSSHTGPYRLLEAQEGEQLFGHYDFFDGPDSIGSAGHQTYVGKKRAFELGLANVTREGDGEEYVYLQSASPGTKGGFRESVRLEGKRRFDRGLFVLDVAHMPAGCGVWPAFWLTDEENWPVNGEIDIVEGINTQAVAKTALHTSEDCDMFAQVPYWEWTGYWDSSTGLPDTFSGIPNYDNKVEADNCWVMAPHQWANQGCVAISSENGTIGEPMNDVEGGVYVLEWDPANGYIKSWVFKRGDVPENLRDSIDTASSEKKGRAVVPEPEKWDIPYAYFAIGDGTGCSSDHFSNMRLIFNLAFCGTVAGNRFFKDCPAESRRWNTSSDSVLTCNAFLASEPEEVLNEAYWKIKGVYVYEREVGPAMRSDRTGGDEKNQD